MASTTSSEIARAAASEDLGLVDALVQLSFSVQAILGAVASRHDLSTTQARMLGILRDREPGMLELAKVLKLEKSSVTGLVDRAEKRGLVTRTAASHDGRAVHVRLTALGAAIAAQCAGDVGTELSALVDGLPASERDELSRLAGRVVHAHAEGLGIDLSV